MITGTWEVFPYVPAEVVFESSPKAPLPLPTKIDPTVNDDCPVPPLETAKELSKDNVPIYAVVKSTRSAEINLPITLACTLAYVRLGFATLSVLVSNSSSYPVKM